MNLSTITLNGAFTLISFISVIAILYLTYKYAEYKMHQNFDKIAKTTTIIASYTLVLKTLVYIANTVDISPAMITSLTVAVTISTYLVIHFITFIDRYYREDYLYSFKWQIFSITTMITPWVVFLYEINKAYPGLLSKSITTVCATTVVIYSHPILQVLDDAKYYRTIKKQVKTLTKGSS